MDKYIEELWRENAIPSSPVFAGRITFEGFYTAITQAMQAQREACCGVFLSEYNSGNYDDPFTFMNSCKDLILNAEVKHGG